MKFNFNKMLCLSLALVLSIGGTSSLASAKNQVGTLEGIDYWPLGKEIAIHSYDLEGLWIVILDSEVYLLESKKSELHKKNFTYLALYKYETHELVGLGIGEFNTKAVYADLVGKLGNLRIKIGKFNSKDIYAESSPQLYNQNIMLMEVYYHDSPANVMFSKLIPFR